MKTVNVLITKVGERGEMQVITRRMDLINGSTLGEEHIDLNVAASVIGYRPDRDLGLRVEYMLNSDWHEQFANGCFARAKCLIPTLASDWEKGVTA